MQFYSNSHPEKGDYVVGIVDEIHEGSGYFVILPEYSNIRGFVGIRDISRNRFRKLKGLITKGTIEVLEVVNIDGSNNIDLSKKFLDENNVCSAIVKYKNHKKIYDWMQHTSTFDERTKSLYIKDVLHKREDNVSDELQSIHTSINNLLKTIEEERIHTRHIVLHMLSKCKVHVVNEFLSYIREECSVTLLTCDTKKSLYTISNKYPCLEESFEKIVNYVTNQTIVESNNTATSASEINTKYNDQPTVNIGIIGHVAHGKTTLIQALTGVDTRRHKKEIQTNRTLKLGYTNIKVVKCTCTTDVPTYVTYQNKPKMCSCKYVHASIIDCPGHNVLLSTMISAAHLMDACILVVAANETCPQNQTKEHIDVLQMIGRCSECLVVQNKVDIVPPEIAFDNRYQIEKFLNDFEMKYSTIIPMSAQKKINVQYVLEYIFKYVTSYHMQHHKKENQQSIGVVVRTFDITKPGDSEVKGVVLGGSVCHGEFHVGQEIIILPSKITTIIKSIQSDNVGLSCAHSGGLIAFQTDINPTYCDDLVGSTFILSTEFDSSKYIELNTDIEVKCYLLKSFGSKKLRRNSHVVIHFMSQNIACLVVDEIKNRYIFRVLQPLYLYNEFEFTITVGSKLIGYGHATSKVALMRSIDKTDIYVRDMIPYDTMYTNIQQEVQNILVDKTIIPVPRVVYQNTFTTITNFEQVCSSIYTSPHTVGEYINKELGCRSWSINGHNQLVLKGRSNEQRVMSVLRPFILYKQCINCKSLHTSVTVDRGVRKHLCNVCGWCEVKRSLL